MADGSHIMDWEAAGWNGGGNNAYIAILGGGAPHTISPIRCMSLAPCLAPEYSQRAMRTRTCSESGINPARRVSKLIWCQNNR